jgi:hypothetical protein
MNSGIEGLSLRRGAALLVLLWAALALLHVDLLRLPYFWDEAGYFIPAARDLFLDGSLVPHTTLSNAHPPLLMLWLAGVWKLFGCSVLATRLSMLFLAAVGLLGYYRLALHVANRRIATATLVLSAIYPTIFAQSSLAQLDMGVFALTGWTLFLYLSGRRWTSLALMALAIVTKETSIALPLTLIVWELAGFAAARCGRAHGLLRWLPRPVSLWKTAMLGLAILPLAAWYIYHRHVTGYILGNPDYLRYNVGSTLSCSRVALALLIRLFHLTVYMNLLVPVAAALLALRLPPLAENNAERPALGERTWLLLVLVAAAYGAEFSLVGGALLARYLIPVVPLVILLCVAAIWRRVRRWRLVCAVSGGAFLLALVFSPPFGISPEDNLSYGDFVRLHQYAIAYADTHYGASGYWTPRILTAWPASDELTRPWLGYTPRTHSVVAIEDFSAGQVALAAQRQDYDLVLAFSTKYGSAGSLLYGSSRWQQLLAQYTGYHKDLSPGQIAALLGGHLVWQQRIGGEWAALIALDRAQLAHLVYYR